MRTVATEETARSPAVKREKAEEDYADLFMNADVPLGQGELDGLLLEQMMKDIGCDPLAAFDGGLTPRGAAQNGAFGPGATEQAQKASDGATSSEGSGNESGAPSHGDGVDFADGPLLPLAGAFDDLIKMEDVIFSAKPEKGDLDTKNTSSGVKRGASSGDAGDGTKSNGSASGSDDANDEEDETKRQARLLRNRESAQLSRQRKKAYLDELEKKLQAVNANNMQLGATVARLAAENAALRRQLAFFYQSQEQQQHKAAGDVGTAPNASADDKNGTKQAGDRAEEGSNRNTGDSAPVGVSVSTGSKVMPPPVFPALDPMYMPATVPGFPPPLVPGMPVPTPATLPLPRLPLGAPGRGGTVSNGRRRKTSGGSNKSKRLKAAGGVATAVLSIAGLVMFADPFASPKMEVRTVGTGAELGLSPTVSWSEAPIRTGRVLTSIDDSIGGSEGEALMPTLGRENTEAAAPLQLSVGAHAALHSNSSTYSSIRVADMALVRTRIARLPSEAMTELGLNSTSFCAKNTTSSMTIEETEETYAGLEKLKDIALVSLHSEQQYAALPSSAGATHTIDGPIPGVLSSLTCSEMFRFKSEDEQTPSSTSPAAAVMGRIGRKALPAAATEARQNGSATSGNRNSSAGGNVIGVDDLSVSVLMPSMGHDSDGKSSQVIVVVSLSDLDYVTYSCAMDAPTLLSSTASVV
mmetsp:Transcript_9852/g.36083  ORF Transcript_9852/g.36083 Transcript_9852/m.36083 type:complete len:695 (-) Transcript_9852:1794-3878(-)